MTLEDHPALLRRFRDSGAAILVTLLTYLLTYVLARFAVLTVRYQGSLISELLGLTTHSTCNTLEKNLLSQSTAL